MDKKILIVEDDIFLQGLAANKLQQEGYSVVTASDGEEGKNILNKEQIDCVLLDLMLPDMSGLEILKIIRDRENNNDIPVIVFSNLSEDKDIKEATDLGATDYLIKSNYTLDELAEKIKVFLA